MTHTLSDALAAVYDKDLGTALNILKSILPAQGTPLHRDRLEDIAADYSRMKEFMLRGYADTQREELYMNCLRRTYSLIQDVELHWLCLNRSVFANARQAAAGLNQSHDFIRSVLEGFVSDVAMLSLDGDEAGEKRRQLYERHYQFLDRLFSALLVSPQWSEQEAQFYKQLFLSPTIDAADASYLVSAVFISNLHLFDFHKFWLLNQLFNHTAPDHLRQRALVGWALSMPTRQQVLYPALSQMMALATLDKQQCEELAGLQKQIFLCMNAEKDHQVLERDVLPTLIKNNNLRIDRFGISEKDDDPMQDILHPEAADEAMEEVERSIRRMMDMERQGADIYFGGFSRMKGFPFFSTLAHWFCPFSISHPSLSQLFGKTNGTRFVENLMLGGAFCDSDKYSLCFGMAQIIDRLPANVREMIGSADALGPMISDERRNSPAYIRRMYLQDLYRFFNLYSRRTELHNPFARADSPAKPLPALFVANPNIACKMMPGQSIDVAMFLFGQKHYGLCEQLLQAIGTENTFPPSYYLLQALLNTERNHLPQARQYYQQVLALEPDNQKAMKGLARLCLTMGDYAQACTLYGQLKEQNPTSRVLAANHGIALIGKGETAEAVKLLYQFYYEYPDDERIKRVLAWALLNDGKYADAQRMYEQLLESSKPLPADCLNCGYCHWLMGDLSKAADYFGRFVALSNESESNEGDAPVATLEQEMQGDSSMLRSHGISEIDQMIMCNIVRDGQ